MSGIARMSLLVVFSSVVGACGACDKDEADTIANQILKEWERDRSKFSEDTNLAPCALPANANTVLGEQRVHEYQEACAKYRAATDGC